MKDQRYPKGQLLAIQLLERILNDVPNSIHAASTKAYQNRIKKLASSRETHPKVRQLLCEMIVRMQLKFPRSYELLRTVQELQQTGVLTVQRRIEPPTLPPQQDSRRFLIENTKNTILLVQQILLNSPGSRTHEEQDILQGLIQSLRESQKKLHTILQETGGMSETEMKQLLELNEAVNLAVGSHAALSPRAAEVAVPSDRRDRSVSTPVKRSDNLYPNLSESSQKPSDLISFDISPTPSPSPAYNPSAPPSYNPQYAEFSANYKMQPMHNQQFDQTPNYQMQNHQMQNHQMPNHQMQQHQMPNHQMQQQFPHPNFNQTQSQPPQWNDHRSNPFANHSVSYPSHPSAPQPSPSWPSSNVPQLPPPPASHSHHTRASSNTPPGMPQIAPMSNHGLYPLTNPPSPTVPPFPSVPTHTPSALNLNFNPFLTPQNSTNPFVNTTPVAPTPVAQWTNQF
eukprot:TRINITY_DN1646_c0_g1_i1.p1 TRINITY_DN1646_c0_g1~~TRINITY_DN1646_c0_g1_i1.p1  ORF type:complete len:454 (-),score=79.88 TRINITY_DN1646_c0_g1_i1:65-1426(-)